MAFPRRISNKKIPAPFARQYRTPRDLLRPCRHTVSCNPRRTTYRPRIRPSSGRTAVNSHNKKRKQGVLGFPFLADRTPWPLHDPRLTRLQLSRKRVIHYRARNASFVQSETLNMVGGFSSILGWALYWNICAQLVLSMGYTLRKTQLSALQTRLPVTPSLPPPAPVS